MGLAVLAALAGPEARLQLATTVKRGLGWSWGELILQFVATVNGDWIQFTVGHNCKMCFIYVVEIIWPLTSRLEDTNLKPGGCNFES